MSTGWFGRVCDANFLGGDGCSALEIALGLSGGVGSLENETFALAIGATGFSSDRSGLSTKGTSVVIGCLPLSSFSTSMAGSEAVANALSSAAKGSEESSSGGCSAAA